jgi:hypothetical protein
MLDELCGKGLLPIAEVSRLELSLQRPTYNRGLLLEYRYPATNATLVENFEVHLGRAGLGKVNDLI